MDIKGIKKIINVIENYNSHANFEVSLGEEGDPEVYWYLEAQAMNKLLQMCRGNKRLRVKLLRKYSYFM